MRREDVLQAFADLKEADQVASVEEAADRIGMSFVALEKALERARAAGDPRGIYKPLTLHTRRRRTARRDALVAGHLALRDAFPGLGNQAHILGTTKNALASALSRARKDGHPGLNRGVAFVGREYILNEWAWLRDSDESLDRAARRLGLAPATLADILREARGASDDRGRLR